MKKVVTVPFAAKSLKRRKHLRHLGIIGVNGLSQKRQLAKQPVLRQEYAQMMPLILKQGLLQKSLIPLQPQ